MRKCYFQISIVFLCLILISSVYAGETFRYKYKADEILPYTITIDSDLEIRELGSLAQLLNLDKMKHNANIKIDLMIKSINKEGLTTIRAVFRHISIVMIAGDSVFTDNGDSWGALKPGSSYEYTVSPRGEIIAFAGSDSAAARQGKDMIQRFFPVFPEQAIDPDYQWTDSLNYEIEMPGETPSEILARMIYTYIGKENKNIHIFIFSANGASSGEESIRLSGEGRFNFENSSGRLLENSGDFVIDADVNLAAFGLPSGLGSVPVNIKSKIDIKLNDTK